MLPGTGRGGTRGRPGARSPEQACDDSRTTPRATQDTTATGRAPSRGRKAAGEGARASRPVYVLDTSVLLSDPAAFRRFAEHEVVLPLVVITELEGKRHHPELGWFARQSLRMLDELRVKHGRLDQPVPVNDVGGTLRVELNHSDDGVLPPGFRTETNDARILVGGAQPRRRRGARSPWSARTCRCGSRPPRSGLAADEYRHGQASDPTWTGMAEMEVGDDEVNAAVRR